MKKSGQLVSKKSNKPTFGGKKVKFPGVKKAGGSGRKVAAPVATTRKQTARSPVFSSTGAGDVHVHHRELLATIPGSVDFAVTSVAVNPGLSGSFPWLSSIANRYQSYKFNSLCFEFITSCSTTFTGNVMLGMDFDAAEAAPLSKPQFMSYRSSVAESPWKDLSTRFLPVDLHKAVSSYIRTGPLAPNLDIKTYDVGNFYVATQGQVATTAVGDLYVEYDLQLLTPQRAAISLSLPSLSASIVGGGSFASSFFGSDPIINPNNSLDIAVSGTTSTITFNTAFDGLVNLLAEGGGATVTPGGTATVRVDLGVPYIGYLDQSIFVSATAGQTLILPVSGTPTKSRVLLSAIPSSILSLPIL
jgi:hypothetical protein